MAWRGGPLARPFSTTSKKVLLLQRRRAPRAVSEAPASFLFKLPVFALLLALGPVLFAHPPSYAPALFFLTRPVARQDNPCARPHYNNPCLSSRSSFTHTSSQAIMAAPSNNPEASVGPELEEINAEVGGTATASKQSSERVTMFAVTNSPSRV